jgi:hypothetical protein
MTTQCFAHHHMTPAEYGFWELCRNLSNKTGILYFDGRNMVKRFAGTPRNGRSKNYYYTLIEGLTKKGWAELLEPRKRNQGGMWKASVYRVLSHGEWTDKHGTSKCKDAPEDSPVPIGDSTCPDNGNGTVAPVLIAGASSPDRRGIQSLEARVPVPLSGHNLMFKPDVVNLKAQTDAKPKLPTCPDSRTRLNEEGQETKCPSAHQFIPPVPTVGQVKIASPDSGTGAAASPYQPIDWDAIEARQVTR